MRDLNVQPFYNVVKEYDHWVVLFRDRQVTLGSLIIMHKDVTTTSLGDVSVEAWSEFGEACRQVEGWLKSAFAAEKFNYLALMMKDPEVHFHVIPRYSTPVEFGGFKFEDVDWPEKTQLQPLELDDDMKKSIYQKLIEVSQ